MAMESFGGNLPAGQPVAVTTTAGLHVFAVAAGGAVSHWSSTGAGWSGPSPLPGGNIVPAYPCAITLADAGIHFFGVTNGGPLTHWRSDNDGVTWASAVDNRAVIPGGGNGLAAASPLPDRIEVFAITARGHRAVLV